MKHDLEYYSAKFAKLHTDKNRKNWTPATDYRAPHKMFLLLSVMELIELKQYETNFIEVTPELLDTFNRYWSSTMPLGSKGNIFLPFFHMQSDKFWHLKPKLGKEEIAKALKRCDSFRQLTDVFLGAKLDDDLFLLMQSKKARDTLRSAILKAYFDPDLQKILTNTFRHNLGAFKYSQELFLFAREKPAEEFKIRKQDVKVRDQGFRKAVTTAYEHRCTMCGIRMLTPEGHTVVDASHIVPWSESHNDDIRNGLSLCKLCHWAFDELLITVSNKYRIKTSPVLKYNQNLPGHLSQMEGRDIIKPEEEAFYPGIEFLHHHQKRFSKVS